MRDIELLILLAPWALVLAGAVYLLLRKTGTAVSRDDANARSARQRADRFEALAEERKTEINRLNGDLSKLRARLDTETETQRQLSMTISRLESEKEAGRTAAEEKIQMLESIREGMQTKFRELATEALKVQGEQFSRTNLEKLQATLTPLKEHVGHFEKELREVHKTTLSDRAALKAEINQLSKRTEAISQEAVALTRALKANPQKQGAWGEMILETILQSSGLREGHEYHAQTHWSGSEGEHLRPDVVVNIPGRKTLIIDSKVSLVAYSEAVNAETEEEAQSARKRHVESMKAHIARLAAKEYQHAEDSTVDYVVLFVPIEGALSEALREDGQLTAFALEKSVTIATPTTLMLALKTVASVWAVERRSRNAEQIARRAGRLYDKVTSFVKNLENVGKRLDQATSAYHDAFGQLSRGRGNLLSQAERLREMGAKTDKSISVQFEHVEEENLQVVANGK